MLKQNIAKGTVKKKRNATPPPTTNEKNTKHVVEQNKNKLKTIINITLQKNIKQNRNANI